jgi:hypothetical protein
MKSLPFNLRDLTGSVRFRFRHDVVQFDPDGLGWGNADSLVFFLFDLLYVNGEEIGSAPLLDRKGLPGAFAGDGISHCVYSDDQIGRGATFKPTQISLKAIVSTRRCRLRA